MLPNMPLIMNVHVVKKKKGVLIRRERDRKEILIFFVMINFITEF